MHDDRKALMDTFVTMKDYFNMIHDDNEVCRCPKALLLSSYEVKGPINQRISSILPGSEPAYLDWENWGKTIIHLLKTKYFFRRFKRKQLETTLQDVKIQTYKRGEIVYLDQRVGVIVNGSVHVKNHPGHNLCTPRLLFKAKEGQVLGFGEGEMFGGTTVDPLTWLVVWGI